MIWSHQPYFHEQRYFTSPLRSFIFIVAPLSYSARSEDSKMKICAGPSLPSLFHRVNGKYLVPSLDTSAVTGKWKFQFQVEVPDFKYQFSDISVIGNFSNLPTLLAARRKPATRRAFTRRSPPRWSSETEFRKIIPRRIFGRSLAREAQASR